jgi:type IV pilus modification protein PilV
MTLKPNREKGFTLIEVLVAISILCFGLLGVAVMQTSAIRGNALASDLTEATVWASDYLEALMRDASADYNAANLSDTTGDGDGGLNDTGANADYEETKGRYTINWNVSVDSPSVGLANTKTVNVIVSWRGQFGTKSVSIQHIIPQQS